MFPSYLDHKQIYSVISAYTLNSIQLVQFVKKRYDSEKNHSKSEKKQESHSIQYQAFKQNVIYKSNLYSDRMDMSWDGRIRTSEQRDQNPLPYHLATPHLDFYSTIIKNNVSIGFWSIPVQISIENLYKIDQILARILTRVDREFN